MNWRERLMGNMTAKHAARWEKVRQKGRARFIWLYGVALWGVSMFVITQLVDRAYKIQFSINSIIWLIDLLIWLIAGYILGAFMWKNAEKQYAKFQQQAINDPSVD